MPRSRSKPVRFPDRERGPLIAVLEFDLIDGRHEVVGVQIRGYDDGGLLDGVTPVTTEALRFPLRQIEDEVRPVLLTMQEAPALRARRAGAPDVDPALVAAAERASQEWRGRLTRPRAGRYDDKHWAQVAAVYDAALRDGTRATVKPLRAVMEEFVVEKSTANKWVSRCRELGLLPPAPGRGRAGRATTAETPRGRRAKR